MACIRASEPVANRPPHMALGVTLREGGTLEEEESDMKRSVAMGGIAAIVILGSLVAGGVIWSTLSRNGVNSSSSLVTETADRAETRKAVQGDLPAWRFEDLLQIYDCAASLRLSAPTIPQP